MADGSAIHSPITPNCRRYARICSSRIGKHSEAAADYRHAAELTRNDREREVYLRKAAERATAGRTAPDPDA